MNRQLFVLPTLALALLSAGSAPAFGAIDFSAFHTPAQIDSELANLAATHPSIATVQSIGTSVEGRSIEALKISDNVNTDESDEGDVVFVALHHAREWISAEIALYMAEYLVTNYSTDAALRACMDNLEIWIIPVLNPDGYVYSASASSRRFWRKNRVDNGDGTFGVDLNRNYAFQWGMGGGGSEGTANTWEDTYWGPSPFSEPETAAFRTFVDGLDHPRALLTYHSFSELFLRPWSYTSSDPPGEPTLAYLAQDSISRIAAVHGHTYAETIWYDAYGETTDYFWNESRLAGFTPELRPTLSVGCSSGDCNDGFAPPPSQILPTAEENLPAALQFIRDAGCRRLWIKDHPTDNGTEPSSVWTGTHWDPPFWVSPDIWTVPATLTGGATVTLNVRVHNDGPAISGATVRAYYTDPRVALEFPNPVNVLIGQQSPTTIPPGDTVLSFSWTVPTGTNIWGERHWCVGAVATHPDDRPLTTMIERTSNIGARNFQTVPGLVSGTLTVAVTNFLDVAAEYRVNIDREDLPDGWEVIMPPRPEPRVLNRKARILGVERNVIEPGETIIQPIRVEIPPDAPPDLVHELQVSGALLPLVPGERTAVGNGYTFRIGGTPEEEDMQP